MNRKAAIVVTLILLGIAIGVLCVFFSAPRRLSDEKIERRRAEYHVVDKWPLSSEISDHADYAPDFRHIFEYADVIVSGTQVSKIMVKDEEMVADYVSVAKNNNELFGEWDQDVAVLSTHQKLYPKYDYGAYWYFDVKNVIWQGNKAENVPTVKIGDKIKVHFDLYYYIYENQFKKDKDFVISLYYNDVAESWEYIDHTGFYKSEDGYLFSFVEGDNANRYTGFKEKVYEQAAKKANKKWQKEYNSEDYVKPYMMDDIDN
ncbi:MAG: hypothetical protein K5858_07385 [Lachnospiraceae bacterium]|nr:hypothetical protein [Lachnospiraceae bacterium]